jgi:hypothetical protein
MPRDLQIQHRKATSELKNRPADGIFPRGNVNNAGNAKISWLPV